MTTLLKAEAIRVEFGALVAVRDVSFELAAGQLLGLVGPNGAGKTTLLRVCAGLHAPTRGLARALGSPVMGEDEIVRHHIGFGPDTPPAYEELSIGQFLRFIGGAYDLAMREVEERIDFWLEKLWLTDRRHSKIKELSRGMRQRVTLARTFLPQPHVILLDEPLAGLDPAGRIQLRQLLAMLREQGCAMIVSSHILSDLEEVATHIAIIEHGSILRWSETAALHHQDQQRRTYHMTTVDHAADCQAILSAIEDVTDIRRRDRVWSFEYLADEAAAAELLARLVGAGVAVVSFTAVRKSLEEAYLQSGVRQVD